MKITLINPPPKKIQERHDIPKFPHLGLGYLSAYLLREKINCEVVDAKYSRLNLEQVVNRIKAQKPDIAGITAMTHEIARAHEVASEIKKVSPDILTVIGGAHASALPDQTLMMFPNFDISVFGEGELTFHELTMNIENTSDLGDVEGIAYRRRGEIHLNDARKMLDNLDELPFPAWELFPSSQSYPVMMGRGCPYRCNFCMRVMGDHVRTRSPENIIAEIERDLNLFNAKTIEFTDETFAIDKSKTLKLLDMMIERGLNKEIKWTAESRVNLADYELFSKMKEAGCKFLGFGIESGNKEILKNTKKGISLDQAINAINMAKKAKLRTGSFFILGHPYETEKTIQDTIDFAIELNTPRVAFGIMVPYPGTEIYNMIKRKEGGYKLISLDWSDFNKQIGNALELENLSRRELEKLQLKAYMKFYLYNYRLIDFIKIGIKERKTLHVMLKKLLKI